MSSSAPLLAHLHDVGVAEARRQARLVEEHLSRCLVFRLLVAQSLDDDQAVYIHRTLGYGEVHIGHPAGAQVGNEAVSPMKSCDDSLAGGTSTACP